MNGKKVGVNRVERISGVPAAAVSRPQRVLFCRPLLR
jgi:hypothetical protein